MRQCFDLDMRNLSRLSLARNTIDNAVTVRKMGHTKLFYDFQCFIEEHLMAFKRGESRTVQRRKLKESHSIQMMSRMKGEYDKPVKRMEVRGESRDKWPIDPSVKINRGGLWIMNMQQGKGRAIKHRKRLELRKVLKAKNHKYGRKSGKKQKEKTKKKKKKPVRDTIKHYIQTC